jgi:hypothetical protein
VLENRIAHESLEGRLIWRLNAVGIYGRPFEAREGFLIVSKPISASKHLSKGFSKYLQLPSISCLLDELNRLPYRLYSALALQYTDFEQHGSLFRNGADSIDTRAYVGFINS